MKNKYLIININGKVFEPEDYLQSKDCSSDMKICIEREVLNIKIPNIDADPKYLKIAHKLGFSWEDNSEIGFVNYDYKANFIMRLLQDYSRNLVNNIGFPIYEVKGSNFFNMNHPVVEAYASLFGDKLFQFKDEASNLVMSYDASYPQFNLARKYNLKEKDLPFAHYSISDCYRFEQSGECMLLHRNRRFFMPDLHPYFKDLDQAWEGYFAIEKKLKIAFRDVNRSYINIAKVSSIINWEQYKDKICEIAIRNEKEILVEIKMDNIDRYWIVDIDYSFIDSYKQVREVGCIQIDIGNAKRLGIEYLNSNGSKSNPVIIHSAVPGGFERFIYMLFDNFFNFPIWLQPCQIRLIPVSEKYNSRCLEIVSKHPNIRIEIDDRNESVAKRIKISYKELCPNFFVVGEKELKKFPVGLKKVIKKIEVLSKNKPFLKMPMPILINERISSK